MDSKAQESVSQGVEGSSRQPRQRGRREEGGPRTRHRWPTARTHPESSAFFLDIALRNSIPLTRPLTEAERLCLGVFAAKPTHHLTLSSAAMGHTEITHAWHKLLRRINRARRQARRS